MKVLLTEDIPGFGRVGEVKEVAGGHARNLLIPKGLAVLASERLIEKVQREQQAAKQKSERDQQKSLKLKSEIEKETFAITGKASKDRLFAQVTAKQIAKAIQEKLGTTVESNQIVIESPIKKLGPAQALLKLGPIRAIINLNIQAHA